MFLRDAGLPDARRIRKSGCEFRESPAMISLAELERRIDKGELSPDRALAQSLDAIATREKAIGAFASLAEAPRAQTAGPLRGIAVGIKDIIETSDLPTEMGSPIYRGFRPRADAPVV